MHAISDVRKAYRLLRRAVALRSTETRVRRRVDAHEPGTFRIAVYFPDSEVNMYQIRQWYRPLATLAEHWPVVVLARSAATAEALLDDGELPMAFVPKVVHLEQYLAEQDVRVVLYVNQNTRNFQMFRYARRWHVFIGHGESDKVYMSSNQYKAYDYALVAGQAARDRLACALWDYDLERRTMLVGRPQTDHYRAEAPYPADDRTVVLYAPTWEGDRATMSYGSLLSHGERLIAELLRTGRHRVLYRPHPRSGANIDAYGAANRRIIQAIAAANAVDPDAHHVHDEDPQVGWQILSADVAVVDVSAMIYDRLAVGKPLLVTRPADPEARIDEEGYLSDCEWLTADAAAVIVAEIERVRTEEQSVLRLRRWVEHYFGDTGPGVATAKLHSAIERLMAEWEQSRAREADEAGHGTGPLGGPTG